MAIETLILLALFTLAPLLEQAWKRWRERQRRAERQERPAAGEQQRRTQRRDARPGAARPRPTMTPPISRTPPGHMPLPPDGGSRGDEDGDDEVVVRVPPPLPRREPDRAPAATSVPAPRLPRPRTPVGRAPSARTPAVHVVLTTTTPTAPRRRAHVWRTRLRAGHGARQAIIAAEILGPCRGRRAWRGPGAASDR